MSKTEVVLKAVKLIAPTVIEIAADKAIEKHRSNEKVFETESKRKEPEPLPDDIRQDIQSTVQQVMEEDERLIKNNNFSSSQDTNSTVTQDVAVENPPIAVQQNHFDFNKNNKNGQVKLNAGEIDKNSMIVKNTTDTLLEMIQNLKKQNQNIDNIKQEGNQVLDEQGNVLGEVVQVDDETEVLVKPQKQSFKDYFNRKSKEFFNYEPDNYYTSPQDSQPVTKEDVQSSFMGSEEETSTMKDMMFNTVKNLEDKIKALREELKKKEERERMLREAFVKQQAANDSNYEKRSEAQNKVFYSDDSIAMADGSVMNYKKVVELAPFEKGLEKIAKSDVSIEDKLKTIKKGITLTYLKHFGGAENIHSVVVSDGMLVFNGIAYLPKIKKDVDYLYELPLDTAEYIKNGRYAALFDWNKLYDMTQLQRICIDTVDFFDIYISSVLRKPDVTYLLKMHRGMKIVMIGDCVIDKNAPNKEENKQSVVNIRRGQAIRSRFKGIFDGYDYHIYNATNGVQGFFVNSLHDYATNRGDKGFFRYSGGVVIRGVGAVAGIGVNAGTHLIGGVWHGVGHLIKAAKYYNESQAEMTDYEETV